MAAKIVAQKFGGTSVATPESRQRVVAHITRTLDEGYRPVVVVSAMGRRGAPYATDTLLDLIHAQGEPVDGRDEDLIFHCGEVISVAIMSHLLKLAGVRSVGLTGWQARIYTDGHWRRAKIVRIDPSRILRHVEQGEVPVIAGGQGATPDEGEITILGRGASDTSGVAVGVAVGAEKVEIYSDVPGVAIADPRVIPAARYLRCIRYRSMYEIGIYGARVMHPGAVLIAQQGGTPIVARSTFSDSPGTLIGDVEDEARLVGIPILAGVDLLTVPGGTRWNITREALFDRFAAVGMRGAEGDALVVAVAPNWRAEVEESLRAEGLGVSRVVSDASLVSLVGEPGFIAESFARAHAVAGELGIPVLFAEQAEIRSTFAVPSGEASRLATAFYETFAA
ncbi:MAG: hypothetical protein Kow00123_16600 [Anaerolineales bacterium]